MINSVETWYDPTVRGQRFRGILDDRVVQLDPNEAVERIKCELVSQIVAQLMETIGPKIDKAVREAWSND